MGLSQEQLAVLKARAEGGANKAIAHELGVSVSTVEGRIRAACKTLNARNVTHAVVIAIHLGLISSGGDR